MSSGNVTVDLASIRRSWRAAGYGEFWVQLRTDAGTDEAFGQAVNEVNELHEGQDFDVPFGELNTRSPYGFVVQLDGADEARLEAWLTEFATRLEQLGFTGTLQAARATSWPRWLGTVSSPELTAFVGWTFDLAAMTADPGRTSHWHVPADATARICEHLAAWAERGGPKIIVNRDTFTFAVTDGTTVARILASAALATGMTGVIRCVDREQRGRTAHLAPGAETTLQVLGGPEPWDTRIEHLRQAITPLAHLTNQAFIRPG